MTSGSLQKQITIAAAGIDRFYDEGFYRWPEDKFRALFIGAPLEEKEIQEVLLVWERLGAIAIRREPECFVEVLRPISELR